MKAFRLDATPWHEGYGIITNNFNKMGMPQIHTSYQYLQAMLAGMKYEEYLIFCEECLKPWLKKNSICPICKYELKHENKNEDEEEDNDNYDF